MLLRGGRAPRRGKGLRRFVPFSCVSGGGDGGGYGTYVPAMVLGALAQTGCRGISAEAVTGVRAIKR